MVSRPRRYKVEKAKEAILVVDDDEAIRGILCRKLGADGFECDVASDGKEALWKARSSSRPSSIEGKDAISAAVLATRDE